MSDFDKAFESVIGLEGGYSNDPKDAGGETNFGISKRAYPDLNIKALTAKLIYKRDYWDKVKGDDLPYPLNAFVFDAAVNQGTDAAIKMLQQALGVAADGILGVVTVGKVKSANKSELCALFMAQRALRYTGTRSFDVYGKGWLKRLFIVAMAA